MSIKLRNSKIIENFTNPYVIAEIGANHNGELDLAKQLIKTAKEAGADCVKFQSWSKESLFSKVVYNSNPELADELDKHAFSESELLEVKEIADQIGIDISSTPFSKAEVDFLVDKLNAPFIKIASMDVNNYPFLEYVASKNVPIFLSTGFADLSVIYKAVKTIEAAGNNQIVILHCVSNYPPNDLEVNLRKIKTLRQLFDYPIGFSDHTLGTTILLASVVLGTCVIEKHFTLDKNMPGWDHVVSANPEELKIMCSETKRIVKALGSPKIEPVEPKKQRETFMRSIVASRDMKKGEIIKEQDIDYKRPGTGIEPGEKDYVIGRKLKIDLLKDELLNWDNFE